MPNAGDYRCDQGQELVWRCRGHAASETTKSKGVWTACHLTYKKERGGQENVHVSAPKGGQVTRKWVTWTAYANKILSFRSMSMFYMFQKNEAVKIGVWISNSVQTEVSELPKKFPPILTGGGGGTEVGTFGTGGQTAADEYWTYFSFDFQSGAGTVTLRALPVHCRRKTARDHFGAGTCVSLVKKRERHVAGGGRARRPLQRRPGVGGLVGTRDSPVLSKEGVSHQLSSAGLPRRQ